MSDLILHHYPNSPFSEKIRLILGHKGLAWRSVMIPAIMPKPDVLALTGGYRKTPFLQIGADIYCDSALMARVIEQHQPASTPTPTLYPAHTPLAVPLAQWADSTLFWAAVAWAMQPAGAVAMLGSSDPAVLKAFAVDRAAFTSGMKRRTVADARVELDAALAALEAQLAAGGPWLFGAQANIADFSVAHCLWFIRRATPVAHVLDAYPALNTWLDRVLAIGHGQAERLDSGEAVAIAAAATAHAPVAVVADGGFAPGERVSVAAIDYGSDAVLGELVGLNAHSVTLRRHDERAGVVQVHFPRIGFQIKKETSA